MTRMLACHAKYNVAGVKVCEAEQIGGRIIWHKAESARGTCNITVLYLIEIVIVET